MEHQAATIARVNAGALSREEGQLSIEHFWAGALRRAVIEGDVENGSVMAGQSVGMVTHEQPTAEIIAEIIAQAVAALSAREAFNAPELSVGRLGHRLAVPG
jgi:enoyl-[acyl-carrier protein] reductase II